MKPAGRLVVLVDDDEDWRGVLAEMLVEEGFLVSTASDGEAALQSILGAKPEVVITDVEMPVMDGCELLARIRGLERGLPVIVMSGQDALDEAISSHAFRVIRKPASLDAVLAAVRAALSCRPQSRLGRLWTAARAPRMSTMRRVLGRGRLAVMAGVGAAAAAVLLIVTIRVGTA